MNREEEKRISLDRFVDILELRAILIYEPFKEIKEIITTEEDFIKLVHVVYDLIEVDNCGFAMLDDDITDKIYNLINIKRYEIRKKYPEEFQLINEIIRRLNRVSYMDDNIKEIRRMLYLSNQEENREIKYKDYNSFLDSMGIDSLVIDYIDGDEIPEDIPNDLLIGSLTYLKKSLPGLFSIQQVKERIEELFDEMICSPKEKKKIEKAKQIVLK